jgi:acyl-CoA reductase-like NAD-dependent aldehyde dehydrogenase
MQSESFSAGNVTLKISATLAAGCTIIVKPSDETPGTAVAIGRCFQDAGVPAGAQYRVRPTGAYLGTLDCIADTLRTKMVTYKRI